MSINSTNVNMLKHLLPQQARDLRRSPHSTLSTSNTDTGKLLNIDIDSIITTVKYEASKPDCYWLL